MNIYLKTISEMVPKSKYLSWYISIIENSISRATTRKNAKQILTHVEGHHILPKCMSNIFQKNDTNNIAYLTSREHILLHWILTRMFKDTTYHKQSLSMMGSFLRVTKSQSERKSVFVYKQGLIKQYISKANKGKPTWNKHKKYKEDSSFDETRELMSIKAKQRSKLKNPASTLFTQQAKNKIYMNNSEKEIRIDKSQESKFSIAGFVRGRLYITCPICGYSCDPTNFKRYHNKQCDGVAPKSFYHRDSQGNTNQSLFSFRSNSTEQ